MDLMETELVHQNEGATQPLRISMYVTCNTPDEKILENIQINSKGRKGWQKIEAAHDRIAFICGSGPSLKDTLPEIRDAYDFNDKVDIFGLNGAAKFLGENCVTPEYQVILDARPKNVDLIAHANNYLFASQVDPTLFQIVPDAKLWHSTHGDIAPEFPDYDDDYCFVGGSISVGNAAMVLAYVMGYRTMHLYGYDSSHRGDAGHAFRQSMNDGDPCTIIDFRNKEYLCSLTMRLQAQYFPAKAKALELNGCNIIVHGDGLLPDMWNAPPLPEQEKYEEVWKNKKYGFVSPGERQVNNFLEIVKPKPLSRIADFGCGCGRGGLGIYKKTKLHTTLIDFVENSRDEEAKQLEFIKANLSGDHLPLYVTHGFCCDVMEHIPTDLVGKTITNIMGACVDCYFNISTVDDFVFGSLIGETLHLTVRPAEWWIEEFQKLGYIVKWSKTWDVAVSLYVVKS